MMIIYITFVDYDDYVNCKQVKYNPVDPLRLGLVHHVHHRMLGIQTEHVQFMMLKHIVIDVHYFAGKIGKH